MRNSKSFIGTNKVKQTFSVRTKKLFPQYTDDAKYEIFKKINEAVDELFKVETETFVRDFSIRFFRDSKVFEAIASKVENLIFEFGDFPDKEQVLGNLNIVKNPTYVNFKGAGKIIIKGQSIDLLGGSYDEVIRYMLENDCKLEQEALRVYVQ